MTVSVVFAIAGVIALLFGIIGGGIKAKEIEIPLLPVKARIVTIIVGLALLGVTVWLENNKTMTEMPISTLQVQTTSVADNPPINPTSMNIPTSNALIPTESVQTLTDTDFEKLYSKLHEAKSWNLVLQDSFNNNDNKWTFWNVDDDWKTETMKIDNSVLLWGVQTKKPDQFFTEIAPLGSYSDFYYSVKIKRVGKPTEEQVLQAIWGLIFRRQGSDFYTLLLNDIQEYNLALHRDTGWVNLIGSTKSSLVNAEGFNELSVIVDGAEISFFINGTPVKTFSDNTLSEGNIGFYAGLNYPNDEVKFEFDDFEIRQKP